MNELEFLRNRVAELEEVVGLTADLPRSLIPRAMAGTRAGAPGALRFIGILLARPFGHREGIYTALYGGRPEADQPIDKILDVTVCYARKILADHDIQIQTIRGEGWRLTDANKAKLRTVIERLNNEQKQAA